MHAALFLTSSLNRFLAKDGDDDKIGTEIEIKSLPQRLQRRRLDQGDGVEKALVRP